MHLGIDGCRGGWLVAAIDDNANLEHHFIKSLNEMLKFTPTLTLIDIPLHFASTTYRTCELEAQTLLGPKKRASIFYTPYKDAVYAVSYAEANELNRLHTGKGVSKQTWNICNKIKEAAAFAAAHPHFPLQEAHPELCFYWLNHRQPLLSKKALADGANERLTIIAAHAVNYPQVIAHTLSATKRADVKADDIIDATVLAIRASASDLQRVPENEQEGQHDRILF